MREAHFVNPSLEAGRGLGRRGLSLGVGMGLGLGRGLGLGGSRSGAHLVDRSRGSKSGVEVWAWVGVSGYISRKYGRQHSTKQVCTCFLNEKCFATPNSFKVCLHTHEW